MKQKQPGNVIHFPATNDCGDLLKYVTAGQRRELRALSGATGASVELLIERALLEWLAKIEVGESLIGILAEIGKNAIGVRKAALESWSCRVQSEISRMDFSG